MLLYRTLEIKKDSLSHCCVNRLLYWLSVTRLSMLHLLFYFKFVVHETKSKDSLLAVAGVSGVTLDPG